MEPNQPRKLLEDLKALDAKAPGPLDPVNATPAETIAHALHCDAVSHVRNAIDALERAISGVR